MIFRDRRQAGERLAESLRRYSGDKGAIVLALPRGGVAVGKVVADRLGLPLDCLIVRKIGHPGNPEYAVGAVSLHALERGEPVSPRYFEREIKVQRAEIRRRLALYRGGRAPLRLRGKLAIIVDDGIATGLSIRAAIAEARKLGARGVVVAAPVAAPEAAASLASLADQLIILERPLGFTAVGEFYEHFPQLSDEEVIGLLES